MKNCLICASLNLEEIYYGKIRSGSAGKFSTEDYQVLRCLDCNVKFLDKFLNHEFYISSEYRDSYNDSSKVEMYHQIHDKNETEKINKISLDRLRNKKVADFGSGGGTFLNVAHSVAKATYAIEPTTFFHHELSLKHKVFSYGSELLNSGIKVDIATSFDVLEHVENPKEYLKEIYSSLVKGGSMYLMTPNYNEILNDFSIKEFDEFNFRTAHYYYFCEKSIESILISAGFSNFKIGFHHKYDISNLLFWLKDKKPTGENKSDLFDLEMNSIYKNYLIRKGKASHLWIKAQK